MFSFFIIKPEISMALPNKYRYDNKIPSFTDFALVALSHI